MADDDSDLAGLLKVSRKRSLNFGLCLGKTPEETVLIMDRRKAPDVLARSAKKQSTGTKTANGTIATEGKLVTLSCEEPLPGMAKKLKRFLISQGQKFNVCILGPDGQVFEQELDEEEETTDTAQSDAAQVDDDADGVDQGAGDDGDDPLRQQWIATSAKVRPLAEAAIAANGPKSADIARLWTALEARAASGGYKAALAALPNFVKLLKQSAAAPAEGAPATGQTGPDPAVGQRLRDLTVQAKAEIAADKERAAVLVPKVTAAATAWKAADMAGCTAALDDLQSSLGAATAPDPKALAAELRDIWDDAKSVTDKQLDALLRKIASDPAPEAAMVADMGLSAWSNGANVRLMKALIEVQNAPAAKLGVVAKKAAAAFAAYDDFLSFHPAVGIMEDNSMGEKVTLRATLGGALKEMKKRALAV